MTKVSSTASCRLRSDYMRIKRDPVPFITAEPMPSNILEWHYVVEGPDDSPYAGGYYHGRLLFPSEYPFRPPSIYMSTPSARFKINTRLCLSISDFHPDSWNPAWSVSTILTGLLSFMLERVPTFGSIESTDTEKKLFAQKSWQFNLDNKIFCELFPDIVESIKGRQRAKVEAAAARARALETSTSTTDNTNNKSGGSGRSTPANSLALFTNVAVVTGFAIFAWLVRNIILSLDDEGTA